MKICPVAPCERADRHDEANKSLFATWANAPINVMILTKQISKQLSQFKENRPREANSHTYCEDIRRIFINPEGSPPHSHNLTNSNSLQPA